MYIMGYAKPNVYLHNTYGLLLSNFWFEGMRIPIQAGLQKEGYAQSKFIHVLCTLIVVQ